MVEYRDSIYIASGGTDIYGVIPGSGAVLEHSCPADSVVTGICTLGDNLFYAYSVVYEGTYTSYIGMYDGDNDAWVDDYKNLTTDLGLARGQVTTLAAYRNRLCAGFVNGLATHTLTSDPTSAWYLLTGPAGSNFSNVTGLKVGG
jgi:hypothetical protein